MNKAILSGEVHKSSYCSNQQLPTFDWDEVTGHSKLCTSKTETDFSLAERIKTYHTILKYYLCMSLYLDVEGFGQSHLILLRVSLFKGDTTFITWQLLSKRYKIPLTSLN